MKKFGLVIVLSIMLSTSIVFAENPEKIKDIDIVVAEIMSSQNVTSEKNIDCNTVKDKNLEELGESVMQTMAGSDEAHEIMNKMMGGNGSKELKNRHITLGKQYLECSSGYGYEMMSSYYGDNSYNNDTYWYQMMGNKYNSKYATYQNMMGWSGLRFAGFALLELIAVLIFVPYIIYLSSKAWHRGANAATKKKK